LPNLRDFSYVTGEGEILETRWLNNREDLLVTNVIHDNYFVEIEQPRGRAISAELLPHSPGQGLSGGLG
jgi:hypothetical protein